MARAPFSVFERNSRDRVTGKPVARFFDEYRNVVKAKTLGPTIAAKATLEAKSLLD